MTQEQKHTALPTVYPLEYQEGKWGIGDDDENCRFMLAANIKDEETAKNLALAWNNRRPLIATLKLARDYLTDFISHEDLAATNIVNIIKAAIAKAEGK